MKTVGELIDALSPFERDTPVHFVQRVKTGYDEGDIYRSVGVTLKVRDGQVQISADGLTLWGSW